MKRNCLVATLLFAGACFGKEAQAPLPPQEKKGPTVEVAQVTEQTVETTLRLQGELSSYLSVALYSRVPGFVDEVLVDRGSHVERGQVLVRLSAPELSAQRAEADSKLRADESTFERLKAAADTPGAVAKHDLEIAEANAQASRERVQSLRALESYLVVKAPFEGLISERNVHPGALVGAGAASTTPMLRIEQVARLRLTVAVPEADVGNVSQGANAQFVVRAWPDERFAGKIERVSHAIDARTRTMPVELDVSNASQRLAPGMFAEVLWSVKRSKPSLLVPASALVQGVGQTFVDRVSEGVIERVAVERGLSMGDRLEVFGNLKPGDFVLNRGSEELKSGAHVQTKAAPATQAAK